jgi:hypothetical protein
VTVALAVAPASFVSVPGVWLLGASVPGGSVPGVNGSTVDVGRLWPGPGTGPPGEGSDVAVGAGADVVGTAVVGVVGPGSNGLKGTQTPPRVTGTWPAGHGSTATGAAIVNTPRTTADHSDATPTTLCPVLTTYNATQLITETDGTPALACGQSAAHRPETW